MRVGLWAAAAVFPAIFLAGVGESALGATGTFNRQGSPQPAGKLVTFAGASNMFILTDGTVMVQVQRTGQWQRLCPDINGSYLLGTWSADDPKCPAIAAIPAGFNYQPTFYASAVLPDGRVGLMGGEFNAAGTQPANQGALYDPKVNKWVPLRFPFGWTVVGDSQSVILPSGQWMIADCCNEQKKQALFLPGNLTWTPTGAYYASNNDEAGWTLLPDGSVLTVDIDNGFAANSNSERWVNGIWNPAAFPSASTQQELIDCTTNVGTTAMPNYIQCPNAGVARNNEDGPNILLADGTVLGVGAAAGNVSIYTPGTNTWATTDRLPAACGAGNNQQCMAADAPAVLLPNGNALLFAGPIYNSNGSHFFEFNPGAATGAKWQQVPAATEPPNAANEPTWRGHMLVLPTGQIMFTDESNDVQIYSPIGAPNSAWVPTVSTFPAAITRGMTYNIYGKLFNGMSQANAYGDENLAATNYPLVRVTNVATKHVFYARTHDHSAMGVAMTSTTVFTRFELPLGAETGASQLEVIANGIPSAKVNVTIN